MTRTIATLTNAELSNLREDITLNSLYLSDYENRYDIDAYEVSTFFDGYLDYLFELMVDDNPTHNGTEVDIMFFDLLPKYDNTDTLISYHNMTV